MEIDFSEVEQSVVFPDGRGRSMKFPGRHDYIDYLTQKGMITNQRDLLQHPAFIQSIYLDWLRRGQVGCIFAQLLGRPGNRNNLHTVVLTDLATAPYVEELAQKIDAEVQGAVSESEAESITILLPSVLDPDNLVRLIFALSRLPRWVIERDWLWQNRLNLIGLRVWIDEKVWAETLGMGPFHFFPPTRQCPVTSLEVRTKAKRSRWSKLRRNTRASHLAHIDTGQFLSHKKHGLLFSNLTPKFRLRALGGINDQRAKARVTFSVPAAAWDGLKSDLS